MTNTQHTLFVTNAQHPLFVICLCCTLPWYRGWGEEEKVNVQIGSGGESKCTDW